MKITRNQHGFSGLLALLVVAILLTVAGIGAYLYRAQLPQTASNKQPDTSLPASSSTSPNGIPGGATGSTGSSSSSSTDVTLSVPEAGFSITVPVSLKDLTYQVTTSGTTKTVNFSTKQLTAAVPSCAANSGSGAFDSVVRGIGTYQAPANTANGGLLKQYSGYYLAYTLPNGPCAKSLSVTNQNLLDDQAQAFYGSLNTVKAL